MRLDVCNGSIWPWPDGDVANATRIRCVLQSAEPLAPSARTGDGFRQHLSRQEAAISLEILQTAGLDWQERPFFPPRLFKSGGSQNRQQRMGPHGQGDMSVPAGPTTHFILVQANFTFGGFQGDFDGPAATGNVNHHCQLSSFRGKNGKGRQFLRLIKLAAYQEPSTPARLRRPVDGQQQPIVPARPFSTITGTQSRPTISRQVSQQRTHPMLFKTNPDVLFARDRQHMGLFPFLKPQSQAAAIAINTVAGHPRGLHAAVKGTCQHLARQGWLSGKRIVGRDARSRTAFWVVRPSLWQIEFPVDQRVAVPAGISQEDTYLAILNATSRAAVLTGNPGRVATFLQKTGLINNQHSLLITQIVEDILPQLIADTIGIPKRTAEQMLNAIRRRLAKRFGQPPAILTSHRTHQPTQVTHRLFPCFRTRKMLTDALFDFYQGIRPILYGSQFLLIVAVLLLLFHWYHHPFVMGIMILK